MNTQEQIKALEQNIKEAAELQNVAAALVRLQANKDFKTVIEQGYFTKEPIRLVFLLGDPTMQTAEKQADIIKQMEGVSALHQYFSTQMQVAAIAKNAVREDEQTLIELAAEELSK